MPRLHGPLGDLGGVRVAGTNQDQAIRVRLSATRSTMGMNCMNWRADSLQESINPQRMLGILAVHHRQDIEFHPMLFQEAQAPHDAVET